MSPDRSKETKIFCIRELWLLHDLTTVDLQKSASSTFEDRRARAKRSDGISKIDPTLEQRPQTLAGGHQLSNVSYMLLQGPQYPILFSCFGFHPSCNHTPIFNLRSLHILFTTIYLSQVCRYQWNLSNHSISQTYETIEHEVITSRNLDYRDAFHEHFRNCGYFFLTKQILILFIDGLKCQRKYSNLRFVKLTSKYTQN